MYLTVIKLYFFELVYSTEIDTERNCSKKKCYHSCLKRDSELTHIEMDRKSKNTVAWLAGV